MQAVGNPVHIVLLAFFLALLLCQCHCQYYVQPSHTFVDQVLACNMHPSCKSALCLLPSNAQYAGAGTTCVKAEDCTGNQLFVEQPFISTNLSKTLSVYPTVNDIPVDGKFYDLSAICAAFAAELPQAGVNGLFKAVEHTFAHEGQVFGTGAHLLGAWSMEYALISDIPVRDVLDMIPIPFDHGSFWILVIKFHLGTSKEKLYSYLFSATMRRRHTRLEWHDFGHGYGHGALMSELLDRYDLNQFYSACRPLANYEWDVSASVISNATAFCDTMPIELGFSCAGGVFHTFSHLQDPLMTQEMRCFTTVYYAPCIRYTVLYAPPELAAKANGSLAELCFFSEEHWTRSCINVMSSLLFPKFEYELTRDAGKAQNAFCKGYFVPFGTFDRILGQSEFPCAPTLLQRFCSHFRRSASQYFDEVDLNRMKACVHGVFFIDGMARLYEQGTTEMVMKAYCTSLSLWGVDMANLCTEMLDVSSLITIDEYQYWQALLYK